MASLDATEDDQAVFTALWLSTQQMLDITLDYANAISRSSNWKSQQCNFAANAQPSAAATQQHPELQADADIPLVCSSEHGATAVCPLFIHFNGEHADCQAKVAALLGRGLNSETISQNSVPAAARRSRQARRNPNPHVPARILFNMQIDPRSNTNATQAGTPADQLDPVAGLNDTSTPTTTTTTTSTTTTTTSTASTTTTTTTIAASTTSSTTATTTKICQNSPEHDVRCPDLVAKNLCFSSDTRAMLWMRKNCAKECGVCTNGRKVKIHAIAYHSDAKLDTDFSASLERAIGAGNLHHVSSERIAKLDFADARTYRVAIAAFLVPVRCITRLLPSWQCCPPRIT